MPAINLLPWREQKRARQQREFVGIGVAALVAAALVFGAVYYTFEQQIRIQEQRKVFLDAEIATLDSIIAEIASIRSQKDALIARMGIIQRLQTVRPEVVHLFDELAKTIPDGVYLKTLKQQDRNLAIEGVAQSNARVSAFMRNLESSAWFDSPDLEVIHNAVSNRSRVSQFKLQIKQLRLQHVESNGEMPS